MPEISQKELKEMMGKYKEKIGAELDIDVDISSKKVTTKEYQDFLKETLPPSMSLYEKACSISEKIAKVKPNAKRLADLQEAINISHMNITPTGAASFAILGPFLFMFLGVFISYVLFQSLFFTVVFLLAGMMAMTPLQNMPFYFANSWRMKCSNQMVLCVFYVVTYMRHTSNLEKAIEFASDHISAPLSVDLKRVLWDVETEKYESVKQSLDTYLETWRKWNLEFIEAFHLIESSLYEGSEERRLALLDKSLDVILEETYEKMMHYAQNLKSPITTLHMIGIILPILGLVILPLMVSFMEGVRWYHISTLYNFVLPITVYLMGKSILSNRPTGYGDTDISNNAELKKYKNVLIDFMGVKVPIPPFAIGIGIFVILLLVALSPLIMHSLNFNDVGIMEDDPFNPCGKQFCLLGYRESQKDATKMLGPYGLGASLLSLAFPLALGLSIGIYFKLKSKNIIKIREKSKQLEKEFASALFQLGNRLGDGLPAEIAFGRVAGIMEGTISGKFFQQVSQNIRKMGMGLKDAIFDPHTGAVVYFPSAIIESSMKVLIQSVKKGPKIAAQALLNISRYIKEIHRVDERLKDLMAEIVSSMKSQINFLTPAISGIVIGITSMITGILGKLGSQMQAIGGEAGTTMESLQGLFGDGIATYYFQAVVGVYVVQLIIILTILNNGIENGEDKLNERYLLGQNTVRSTLLYVAIALFVMILFNWIAGKILVGTMT